MSALTANNVLQKKDIEAIQAFPVLSGETIYQDSICGIGVDGLLKNISASTYMTILIACIIADDSANTTPAATTGSGSIAADRTSAEAGDKTVRQTYTKGKFLLSFTDTLTQADVGKIAYAVNNNDCSVSNVGGVPVGTIVGFYSASLAWVELNVFIGRDIIRIKQAVAGVASTGAGALFTIDNPFGGKAILESFVFDITTASTGAATADIGVGTSSSVDNLMDGLTLNGAVAGIKTPVPNAGTNGGKLPKGMTSSEKVLGTGSADTSGLVGTVEATFRRYS